MNHMKGELNPIANYVRDGLPYFVRFSHIYIYIEDSSEWINLLITVASGGGR